MTTQTQATLDALASEARYHRETAAAAAKEAAYHAVRAGEAIAQAARRLTPDDVDRWALSHGITHDERAHLAAIVGLRGRIPVSPPAAIIAALRALLDREPALGARR